MTAPPDLIPAGWKDRDRYTLEDAAELWAAAFYGRPLNLAARERVAYARAYHAALDDLQRSGKIQGGELIATARNELMPPNWVQRGSRDIQPRYQAIPEKRAPQWIAGPALAALATERGKPGVFGFDPERGESPDDWLFTHDTMLLREVRWAIKTWWEGKPPEQWPSKELAVEKLMENRKLTRNEAEAVDLIVRHDTRRRRSNS